MYFIQDPTQIREILPEVPYEELSERYHFIDTNKVIADMEDLGLRVHEFKFPAYRTQRGKFGLHEVDFRRKEDFGKDKSEIERILFLNSYDGSRRAQVISGVFRLVCYNGLIAGNTYANEKFLHVGSYEADLVGQIKEISSKSAQMFDDIESYKTIQLDNAAALRMARIALEIREPAEGKYAVDPAIALMPRRIEDNKKDLWTRWNVLQENLLKGGLPSLDAGGNVRYTREVKQITKTHRINRELWNLLEETAEQTA